MDTFLQQLVNGLVMGCMYAMVALGYTMVYGIISLINFAHGEVLMVGAMVAWTLITAMQDAGSTPARMAAAGDRHGGAVAVCAFPNFSIERIAYRPLRNAPRLAPLITAIGMSVLLQALAMVIWKPTPKPFPNVLPLEIYEVHGRSSPARTC